MRLWPRRRDLPPLLEYEDDGTLPVRVRAQDPAVADSAVLAGVDVSAPLLVRHFLVLPAESVEQARVLLAQDGYRLTAVDPGPPVQIRAWRTQLLTPMSASQERSRMAGLAQRLGGDVDGWDASGPPLTGKAAAP